MPGDAGASGMNDLDIHRIPVRAPLILCFVRVIVHVANPTPPSASEPSWRKNVTLLLTFIATVATVVRAVVG